MFLRSLLLSFVLLIHLQTTAGELINISDISTLKPVISTALTNNQATELKRLGAKNGGKFLTLHMVVNGKPMPAAVACRYKLDGLKLSLTPMYKLGYNLSFEAQNKTQGKLIVTSRFKTPPHPLSKKTASVVTAYPMTKTIPHNTLFFNVRFSHTMANDRLAYKYIKVYDEQGTERTTPWRQKSFWLDDGKLLTLMIHPGRVKNGIHYESPLFDSGKTYTLTISKNIKDINGNPIAKDYSQKYYVTGDDRVSPRVLFNKTILPKANTTQPVLLHFSEGIDNATMQGSVFIYNEKGDLLQCSIIENGNDNIYKITPTSNWRRGKYTLVLKSAVYDFAANRINRLFEVTDIKEIETDKIDTKWSFEIK